jgi:hypothetical protein
MSSFDFFGWCLLLLLKGYGLNLKASMTRVWGLFLLDGRGSAKLAQISVQLNATGASINIHFINQCLSELYSS